MGIPELSYFQPRGAVDLFRRGVSECLQAGGAAWLAAFGILLAPTVIAVAGQVAIAQTGAMELMQAMQKGEVRPENLDAGEMFGAIALLVGVGVVTGLVSMLAQYGGGVAIARMQAERALGRSLWAAAAWDFVLGRAAKVFSGALVMLLVIAGAAIAGQIPGGIVAAVLGMSSGPMQPGDTPPLIMRIAPMATMLPVILAASVYLVAMVGVTAVENFGGFPALSRSFRLAGGRFWHVLGAIVLAGLAFTGPGMAVGMLAQSRIAEGLRESQGAMVGTLIIAGGSSLLSLLLSPFMMSVQAAIYFDLRSRLRDERFTPYELALDVGGELPAGVSPPPEETDWSPPPSDSSASALPPPPSTS